MRQFHRDLIDITGEFSSLIVRESCLKHVIKIGQHIFRIVFDVFLPPELYLSHMSIGALSNISHFDLGSLHNFFASAIALRLIRMNTYDTPTEELTLVINSVAGFSKSPKFTNSLFPFFLLRVLISSVASSEIMSHSLESNDLPPD